jgi:hypothetical protein
MGSRPGQPVLIGVHRARYDSPHRSGHHFSVRVVCQVPARSHDGSPCTPFRGGSHDCRSSSSWPQRVKLPTGVRPCSNANECDTIPTITRLRTPAHPGGCERARSMSQEPGWDRRLATAPGPDPVAPAARLTSFACANGHPVVDSTRACASFGCGPADDLGRRQPVC